jgi:hypothetical protein
MLITTTQLSILYDIQVKMMEDFLFNGEMPPYRSWTDYFEEWYQELENPTEIVIREYEF